MTIHEQLKAAGVPLDSHESDLYAKATPEAARIVSECAYKENVTAFQSNGETWYDIPFAYDPWWENHAR